MNCEWPFILILSGILAIFVKICKFTYLKFYLKHIFHDIFLKLTDNHQGMLPESNVTFVLFETIK